MTKNNYDKSSNVIIKATHYCCRRTIADAVEEINTVDDEIVDTSVSCDGSWQRRGYSSLNPIHTGLF